MKCPRCDGLVVLEEDHTDKWLKCLICCRVLVYADPRLNLQRRTIGMAGKTAPVIKYHKWDMDTVRKLAALLDTELTWHQIAMRLAMPVDTARALAGRHGLTKAYRLSGRPQGGAR